MKNLPLLALLILLTLACSLTGAPTPTATIPPLATATQAQVPTEAAGEPTATTEPTLPLPVPTSSERPCLPSERLSPIPNPDPNGPFFHQVLIATSSDGLTWQTNGQIIIDQASVPEAVRLPDGRWVMYAVNGSALGGPGFLYAESQDEGRTWTCGTINLGGADPDVVLLPDGRIRLYYVQFPFGPHPPQPGTTTEPNRVMSAISSDGKNFTTEEGTRLEGIGYTDPDVILVGDEWFMYVSTGEKAWAARSSDGLNFTLIGLVNETGAVSGSYLFPDGTLRHYYCGREGIQSATSSGGGDIWRAEPGTRIARDPSWKIVCDPSVASDGHGGYWMAYKIQPSETARPSPLETVTPPPIPTGSAADSKAVLYLGIMVHLEGWNDDQDQARFARHAHLMREYASLFETYGARLTWESKEVTEGALRWGDNVLIEMQQRGHGVGVHADIGGQRNYDCSRFAADLRAEKEQLESLGVTVRHVSGIVSHCDWVTAAADAGYLFTTGQVAYAVMSMPRESRPPQFRDCPGPAACHDTFPTALADRLHPWRMNSGLDWLTPSPNGRLVLIPSSGELTHMEEDATGQAPGPGEDLTQADIDYFIRELEQAIALAQPGQVNTYYVSWSLGTPLDPKMIEIWLQRIDVYVKAGQVEWKTLPEMYDAYVQNEQ